MRTHRQSRTPSVAAELDMGSRQNLSTYHLIWETVRQIPEGKVATYGEVAREAGLPGQARLVGYALHNLPSILGIPWHRVINAQGRISLPKASGDCQKQKRLLLKEGVAFVNEKIELKKFGWLRPPRRSKPIR